LPEFAAKYVKGFLNGGSYEAIPLEMNAYELDTRFATRTTSLVGKDDPVKERTQMVEWRI
jgi:hypothetical protein